MPSDEIAARAVDLAEKAVTSAHRAWHIWLFVSGFALGVIFTAAMVSG